MRNLSVAAVLLGVVLACGCASICGKSRYPVVIDSNPSGAQVVIRDSKGNEVRKGMTPLTVKLRSSDGFFDPAQYTVVAEKEGYCPASTLLCARMNEWYLANTVMIGGVIGALLVDPATGAMWKLTESVCLELAKQEEALADGETKRGKGEEADGAVKAVQAGDLKGP